jgi:alpha/beta superfamily hydrolase
LNSSALNERVSIPGPAGVLEVLVEEAAPGFDSYAVICHPHPLYGGTMDNKVVTTLARAFHDTGIPTLRFNFRGVGASAGAFDQGAGETDDADAVAGFGDARWPGKTLAIAGFSFGGYVALRLALARQRKAGRTASRTARLITVAPAIQRFDITATAMPDCPWLVVQGEADDVVDPSAVIAWARGLTPPPRLVVLPGVGHFFHGHLHELRDAVIESIRSG